MSITLISKRYITIAVIIWLLCLNMKAIGQPDQAYINKFEGINEVEKVTQIASGLKSEQLGWEHRTAPGLIAKPNQNSRLQASLVNWEFVPIDSLGKLKSQTNVNLPHHFENKRDYHAAWYIKKINLDKENGQRYIILLDQVKMFCRMVVNGMEIDHHFGGLTPFEFDITNAVQNGDNYLCLYVYDQLATIDDDKAYNQLGVQRPWDLKPVGGFNRIPVLEKRNEVFVSDVFVKTSTRKKEMIIEYELKNTSLKTKRTKIEFNLIKWPNGEEILIDLPVTEQVIQAGVTSKHEIIVSWEDPQLWSPENPELYVLRTSISSDRRKDLLDTRFGFREFWIEGKTFFLNGKPIRLRGESSYDQHTENSRDFHRELFKLQKEKFNLNANRLHAHLVTGDATLGADEAGILLIDQSAIWSVMHSHYRKGGDWFLANIKQEFEEWVRRDRNSPSVVIWDVENEMLRISKELNLKWVKKLNDFVLEWDDTRPICNSGAGWFDEDQDMVHLHMQEHYTKIMDDWKTRGDKPLIMGEFWIGGRGGPRLPTAIEFQNMDERYIEEAKCYQDQILIMRKMGVSGVMPFRISNLSFYEIPGSKKKYFLNASNQLVTGIRSTEVTEKVKHALQPLTAFVWPRQNYLAADVPNTKEIIICNDSENYRKLEVSWGFEGQEFMTESLDLGPAAQETYKIQLPPIKKNKKFIVSLRSDGKEVSSDTINYHVLAEEKLNVPQISRDLIIYKGEEQSKESDQVFTGITDKIKIGKLPINAEKELFMIAEEASDRYLDKNWHKLVEFVEKGGRILCLKQNKFPRWSPIKLEYWSALQPAPHTYQAIGWTGTNKDLFFSKNIPLLDPAHPVFDGITTSSLNNWNPFDGRVSDDVFLRPSNLDNYYSGAFRVLAAGTRREQVTLAEAKIGKGIILFCQAHVMENIQNPQAKALLHNMLSYLDNEIEWTEPRNVSFSGSFTANHLQHFLKLKAYDNTKANPSNGDVMVATDGSSMEEVKEWANAGGKALVLSNKVSDLFQDVEIEKNNNYVYSATVGCSHRLLTGVSSANFLNYGNNSIQGYFSKFPPHAKILLNGFQQEKTNGGFLGLDIERFDNAGPVALSLPFGKGEIILTTLTPWELTSTNDKELFTLLLANAGVDIPSETNYKETIRALNTVPIQIDGKLNDWTDDMEDRLVSQYVHAQPIYLKAENAIEGDISFDLDFSGIAYTLWDNQFLYLSGVVFKENRRIEAGEPFAENREFNVDFYVNSHKVEVEKDKGKLTVKIDGNQNNLLKCASGILYSQNFTDAQNLDFRYIHKSGKIQDLNNVPGETFEVAIPWSILRDKDLIRKMDGKILIRLKSDKGQLQNPFDAESDQVELWNDLKFESNAKNK